MKTTLAAILLPLIVLNATVATGTGESVSKRDAMDCGSFTFGCKAWASATLTVEECDETTCRMTIDASIVGSANLVGTHAVQLTLVADGASVCVLGGLADASALGPCEQFCQRLITVGYQAACAGSLTFNKTMPRGGNWTGVLVAGTYGYNQGLTGKAYPSVHFFLRQLPDGTVAVF